LLTWEKCKLFSASVKDAILNQEKVFINPKQVWNKDMLIDQKNI